MTTQALERFVKGVKQQISQGETQLALDQLNSYLSDRNTDLYETVILRTAQYNRLAKDEMRGVITRDVAQAERAVIENSLLEILERLPNQISLVAPEPLTEVDLPDEVGFEKILGINNLKQIAWIEQGTQLAKSVCRILAPDGRGTGFLIAPGILMTNNHVIPSPDIAQKSWVEFNYQQGIDGRFLETHRYKLDTERFHTSPQNELDYTIVRLLPDSEKLPLEEWGYLQLNPNADPVPSEHVVIIQHPMGGPKQMVLTANQVVSAWEHRLHYTTDTMPGSSGSPVFNDVWQVIAIHHAGGSLQTNSRGERRFVNEGILMSAIKSDAGDYWPEQPLERS